MTQTKQHQCVKCKQFFTYQDLGLDEEYCQQCWEDLCDRSWWEYCTGLSQLGILAEADTDTTSPLQGNHPGYVDNNSHELIDNQSTT